MYVDLGTIKPGATVFVPFHTFDSNDPSASVTITGLATTDIEVYKDASMTQRASDAGYALVDTDGIDLDTITGIHGVTIDTSDNTTAGFWAAGSDYVVVISSITVDAATINLIAARFRLGYESAILNTTLETLASQTSFTLTAGSADDDAYNGCIALVHDVASDVQVALGVVSDYTGSTRTVTLAADPGIFTMAAPDNISLFPPANVHTWLGNAVTASAGNPDVNVESIDDIDAPATWKASVNAEVDTALTDIHLDHLLAADYDPAAKPGIATALLNELVENDGGVSRFTSNALEEAWQATTRVLTANTNLNDPTAATIADAVWDEAITDHSTQGSFGENHNSVVATAVNDASATTTVWITDLTEATDDHFNGRSIVFITGNLAGQATDITDYNGTTKAITVTAVTEAPADNDRFIIV